MKTTSKTDRARTRTTLSICSLALAVAAGACGQRGPLYLPDQSSQETRDQEKDSENEKTP